VADRPVDGSGVWRAAGCSDEQQKKLTIEIIDSIILLSLSLVTLRGDDVDAAFGRRSPFYNQYADFRGKITHSLLQRCQLPDTIPGTSLCKPREW
jgi:hypothetical protein